MSRGLTLKCEQFCRDYVLKYRGDGTRTAFNTFDCNNEATAASIASEYLKKPKIIAEIERIKAILPENVTEEVITLNIANLAFNSKSETVRTKNLELLAKIKAMLIEKREVKTSQQFTRSEEFAKLPLNEMISVIEARLKLNSQGVNTSQEKENVPK